MAQVPALLWLLRCLRRFDCIDRATSSPKIAISTTSIISAVNIPGTENAMGTEDGDFMIITKERMYHLVAASATERQLWVVCINAIAIASPR